MSVENAVNLEGVVELHFEQDLGIHDAGQSEPSLALLPEFAEEPATASEDAGDAAVAEKLTKKQEVRKDFLLDQMENFVERRDSCYYTRHVILGDAREVKNKKEKKKLTDRAGFFEKEARLAHRGAVKAKRAAEKVGKKKDPSCFGCSIM